MPGRTSTLELLETDQAFLAKADKAIAFLHELNIWLCYHRPTRDTLVQMREATMILELAVNTERRWASRLHREVSGDGGKEPTPGREK